MANERSILRRRSSLNLIAASKEFKYSIANLSIGQPSPSLDVTTDKSTGNRMRELVKCEIAVKRACDVFLGRRAALDLPKLPVAAARQNVTDLQVDNKYAEYQKGEVAEPASQLKPTPRHGRRRASVDSGSLHRPCETGCLLKRCSSQSILNSVVELNDAVKCGEDTLFTGEVDFQKTTPRLGRRRSTPILDFEDVRRLSENPWLRTTSGKEKSPIHSEKWLKFLDTINHKTIEEEKQSYSLSQSDGDLTKRSKRDVSRLCQKATGLRQQHFSDCIRSGNTGDGKGNDVKLQLPPSRVDSFSVLKNDLARDNGAPSLCKATHKQPAPENKRGVRSELRSELIGGKHTQARQSTKQNWRQINQYLQALEEEIPTYTLLEIKRLRKEWRGDIH